MTETRKVRIHIKVFTGISLHSGSCSSDKPWVVKKRANARCGTPPLKLFTRGVLETPGTIQTVGLALVCPSELDSKTLLLKTRHRCSTGYGGIKLVLTRLAHHVLEGAVQDAEGQKSSAVLSSCDHL